jgi:hypothetical protein
LIALALSVIERIFLPARPVFFVTAGLRGGGKTTALLMIALAATGIKAAAAAWSHDPNERKKAFFAYLLEALPFLVWDNIPRGTKIACPHIERAATAETYTDRILGESKTPSAPAYRWRLPMWLKARSKAGIGTGRIAPKGSRSCPGGSTTARGGHGE